MWPRSDPPSPSTEAFCYLVFGGTILSPEAFMATCLNRCSLVTVAGLVLGVCMTAEAKPFPKGTYAIKLGKNEEKLALKFESKGKFTLLRFGDEVASRS